MPGSSSVLDDERIDRLWVEAAARAGFRVERTRDAYASTDGRGAILVGARDTLDDDDSLAQLVLHELCHALVEGEASLCAPDWGLDNTGDRDLAREHACLRLQAHLADAHALRPQLVPTTVSRAYYQALPAFPLAGDDEPCVLARAGARRAAEEPWRAALEEALSETAALLAREGRWTLPGGRHPLGGELRADERCGTCAWRYESGGGSRCRQAGGRETGPRVDPRYPACARWETALDCRACGACCREGFDRVSVAARDPVVWRHPSLVVRDGPRLSLRRAGGRCAALEPAPRHTCLIYEDRPQACRDLAPGSARCLEARRQVGLGG